jgi:hypothetical protein
MRLSMIKTIRALTVGLLLTGLSLADPVTEYDLKAAYLLNFASYVEWPTLPDPITVCVYGENPFKETTISTLLEAKKGQIDISFKNPRQLEQLTDCNILYLPLTERGNVGKASNLLHNAPVLFVTDVQDGFPAGAMINLVTETNRLRFEVNLTRVLESKLKISSKMLKLAKIVPQ